MKQFAVAIAALALTLTGCASPNAPQPIAQTPSGETTSCEPLDQATLDRIAAGFNTDGLTLDAGYTTPNGERQNVRYLAATISGPGIDAQPALWATNDDPATTEWDGILISVDAIAQEFTDWPNGPADDPITAHEQGGQEALACLE